MLLAIDFMHNVGIVPRDIKLDNILINRIEGGEYNVKIGDFGLAMKLPSDGTPVYEICGTPGYIAPEVLRNQGYREKCDIFSIGAVFFIMLTGKYLWDEKPNQNMMKINRACDLDKAKQRLNKVSPRARDLVLKMLEIEVDKRCDAKEALSHDWFKDEQYIINDLLDINK